jgi:hypothetical protein
VQVRVADPEVAFEVSVTVAALREHPVPAFCERLTVPVKPFSAVTSIVDVPELPARTCVGETAPAEMLKSSGAAKVNVALVP